MRSFIFNKKSAFFFLATAAASTLFTQQAMSSSSTISPFKIDENLFFNPAKAKDLLQPPKTPQEHQFLFAGFHGTVSAGSLCKNLISDENNSNFYKLASADQKQSTARQNSGELGEKGLYVATDLITAFLYGVRAAHSLPSETEQQVVVFEVFYDSSQQWNEPPTIIRSSETFENIPPSSQSPPHDTLVVQNDGNNLAIQEDPKTKNLELRALKDTDGAMHAKSLLPTQYKVNPHKLSSLRFAVKSVTKTADDAWVASDAISEVTNDLLKSPNKQNSQKELPLLKVMPDGNCMFHSLAWHLKMNSEERGKFLKELRESSKGNLLFSFEGQRHQNISQFFGFQDQHLMKTMELKNELVDWMLKADPETKAKLEEKWNLITVFGEDTAFFGESKTLAQYLAALKFECDEFFAAVKTNDERRKIRASRTGVFADIQLFYSAIAELYPNRPVIVYTQEQIARDEFSAKLTKPLMFLKSSSSSSLKDSFPIEIVITWGSLHYNAVSFRGPFVTQKTSKL
jgi:hypothetical protein